MCCSTCVLTHCLIPALGLMWFVASPSVWLATKFKDRSPGWDGVKGWILPLTDPQSYSVSCKLSASMLMDKRVLLNKQRDWRSVSGVGLWMARLECFLTFDNGADTILYLTWLNFSSHNKSQISVLLHWWCEVFGRNTVSLKCCT